MAAWAKKEAIDKLQAISRGDQEYAHCRADEAVTEFLRAAGYGEIADAWDAVADECGGFWYA